MGVAVIAVRVRRRRLAKRRELLYEFFHVI